MSRALATNGFELIPSLLDANEVGELRMVLESLGVAPGHRRLMERAPAVAALAGSAKILELLREKLDAVPFPVRSIFFDKTPEANWLVPWHQDLSIAVQRQLEVQGYGPWSIKDGIPHVQPPLNVLEGMVTLRIHLDDCGESNGALRVIPGSHRLGRLDAVSIAKIRAEKKEALCTAQAGDAILMRPLLLHASSAAVVPSHRRVVHLEYATCSLAKGLEWAEGIGELR